MFFGGLCRLMASLGLTRMFETGILTMRARSTIMWTILMPCVPSIFLGFELEMYCKNYFVNEFKFKRKVITNVIVD